MNWAACILTLSLLAAPAAVAHRERIEALRTHIETFRSRAHAWTRMTYYDEARRELIEADRVFQAAVVLGKEHQNVGSITVDGVSWNLGHELELLRLREDAHRLAVKALDLPERTLGFILIPPYRSDYSNKPERDDWYVAYTVAPEGLTKAGVAADPMRYGGGAHIPGSRSSVAYYLAKPPAAAGTPATFEKQHVIPVPDGFTPYHLQPGGSGRLWVHMTRATGMAPGRGDPTGFMLCVNGELATIGEGPCAGPVIAPGEGETRIDALAADWMGTTLYALKRTGTNAVFAVHSSGTNYRLHDDLVTFEGKDIAEITTRGNPNIEGDRKMLFKLDPDARITQDTAKVLGRLYELRHELDERRLVLGPLAFTDPKIAFDIKKKEWVLTYDRGSPMIAGISRSVILDEQGRLVSIGNNWYAPR